MNIENVPLYKIDRDDQFFRFGSDIIHEDLKLSIKRFGILNPVKLIRNNDRFTVLCGWKRLHVVTSLNNFEYLPAYVYSPDEISIPDFILLAYYDNYHRINELDKALIIKMMVEKGNVTRESLLSDYMPLLGIPASFRNLEKYSALSSLDKDILNSFYQEKYSIDHLCLFSEIEDPDERNTIYKKIFLKKRFNLNESREVLKNIREIARKEGKNINSLLEEITSDLDDIPGKQDLRRILKERRYPKLSAAENKFTRLLKTMEYDPNVLLKYDQNFESNELEFRIRFNDPYQLENSIKRLKTEIQNGKIKKIIDFIRMGTANF